jgi:ribose 5-phosphate isomerase RpiB
MSFFTARQLEDLHKRSGANGQLVLPYRARLTPAARDWVKSRRLTVGYSDDSAMSAAGTPAPADAPSGAAASVSTAPGAFVWWCDGPCGPAKAVLVAQEKASNFHPLDVPADARHLVSVVKRLAADVKSGTAAGGVLMVQSGASALVLANRCPSLRAVLGTCLEAVEQGVTQVAANVLVVEYPHKTLQQMKNMLARFVRGKRELSEDLRRQLQELALCG